MEENTYGSNGTASGTSKNTSETTSRSGRPAVHNETVYGFMEEVLKSQGRIATFNETVQATHLPESTVSRLRNSWLQQPRTPVKPPEVFHVKPEPIPEAKVISSVSRETKGGQMNEEVRKWNNTIKSGLKFGAYFLWLCSIVFSLFGLIGVLSEREPIKGWLWWFFLVVSFGLSSIVTLLELALNREDLNSLFRNWKVRDLILWIFGVCSYAYDIYTNVAGISLFVIGTANIFHVHFTDLLIPAFFGVAIAIGPEPMLMKSIEMKYERNGGNPQQQQKQRIPVPPPNTIKQVNTVSPYMDPAVLAKLQQTHPYRPANKQ